MISEIFIKICPAVDEILLLTDRQTYRYLEDLQTFMATGDDYDQYDVKLNCTELMLPLE